MVGVEMLYLLLMKVNKSLKKVLENELTKYIELI